jgi:hypothetical protein
MSRSLSSGAHSRDPLAHPGYGMPRGVADWTQLAEIRASPAS